jgi:hypothetical protein
MATIEERDLLVENILLPVGRNSDKLSNSKITGFLSMAGNQYNHELMVIGRAVNGWTEGVFPNELTEPILSNEYAEKVFNSVVGSNNYCPMTWVTECWGNSEDYNTKRSAFWRVIRTIVGELGISSINEKSWPSHIIWSNLFKVAPADGGNPNKTLCSIQQSGCISLLDLELSTYIPKRLLLLTGLSWAEPFLMRICPEFKPVSNSHVEAVGQCKFSSEYISKIVVATHPQGKPENAWSKQVLEAFHE